MHLSKFLSIKTPRKWEQLSTSKPGIQMILLKRNPWKKHVVHFPIWSRFWFSRILKLHIFEKNGWKSSGGKSNPTRQKILELSWIAQKNTIFLGALFPIPKKTPMNFLSQDLEVNESKKRETSKGMCECLEIVGQRNLPNTFGRYLFNMCLFFRHFRVPQEMLECWHVQYAKKMQIRCNKNDKNGTFQRLLSLLPNWGFGVCFVFPARCGVASVFETSQHICCLCTLVVRGFQSRKGVETST